MEALTTTPNTSRVSSSSSSLRHKNSFALNRHESCFLRTRKVSSFGLLSSFFAKQSKTVCPFFRVSPKAQTRVDLEEDEVQSEETEDDVQTEDLYESKTVRVKFQLAKECLFGQRFFVVGNDQIFGLWDPKFAAPLNWSAQHVWFAELDVPIGKLFQYKFVLKDITGEIIWQPGPDRLFQAWETENIIIVSDAWENPGLQVITELELKDGSQNDGSDLVSASEDIVVANGAEQSIEDPFEEMPRTFDDGSATTSWNNNGGVTISLVDYEGQPVLVPGLPPLPEEVITAEDNYNQTEEHILFNDTFEVIEAKEFSMPEKEVHLDEQQKVYDNRLDEETIIDGKKAYNEDEKECEESEENTDILVNDLKWGHKTLQKLFTNFRLF